MIPVLIAPVYNRHDLLERMLASVDHPVELALVVDNGLTNYTLGTEGCPSIDDLRVFEPPVISMGYGGSINYCMTQTPGAPWWLFANNDIEFGGGDLDHIVELMEETTSPRVVTRGFWYGAINRAAVDQVGFNDEWSFWPIYFDDNDYYIRCKLAGVEWIEFHGNVTSGDGNYEASLTINSDPKAALGNRTSYPENQRRYIAKWGGMPGKETFTSPWNSGQPVWTMVPDLEGRARRIW